MSPTYVHDEYVLVETLSHRFFDLSRGDVIVFRNPHDEAHITMKRVIGLPSETVFLSDNKVSILHKNGSKEDFNGATLIGGGTAGQNGSKFKITLGPEDYFVLGDNRSKSTDSRDWGAVQLVNIVGKPIFNYQFTNFQFSNNDKMF